MPGAWGYTAGLPRTVEGNASPRRGGNHMSADARHTTKAPQKLRLADLQVQSFVTALDEHEAGQIAGGLWIWSRVSECFAESINLCENVSVHHPEKGC